MNKWLRFGRMYPHYILRLFRNGSGKYEEKTDCMVKNITTKVASGEYEDTYLNIPGRLQIDLLNYFRKEVHLYNRLSLNCILLKIFHIVFLKQDIV